MPTCSTAPLGPTWTPLAAALIGLLVLGLAPRVARADVCSNGAVRLPAERCATATLDSVYALLGGSAVLASLDRERAFAGPSVRLGVGWATFHTDSGTTRGAAAAVFALPLTLRRQLLAGPDRGLEIAAGPVALLGYHRAPSRCHRAPHPRRVDVVGAAMISLSYTYVPAGGPFVVRLAVTPMAGRFGVVPHYGLSGGLRF